MAAQAALDRLDRRAVVRVLPDHLGGDLDREQVRATSPISTLRTDDEINGDRTLPRRAPARVEITVLWPDRDYPGFKAQLIPLTTRSLVLRALKGANVLAETTLVRQPGEATASASLELDAASNVALEVKAYREEQPAAGSLAIARGARVGLNLEPSQALRLTLPGPRPGLPRRRRRP